jgi:hypothetical protein|tara:strand:+ start:147 stop:410 length:264 start_codon:yes stop_codon:yes gene_type:complete
MSKKQTVSLIVVSLGMTLCFIEPIQAGQTSDYCAKKWARSESFGGSYGEAMMGIRNSAPDCYCQADINKVKTMGPEVTASYLSQCKK